MCYSKLNCYELIRHHTRLLSEKRCKGSLFLGSMQISSKKY
ncbi:hypothetical protein HMPREF9420_0142 [Segatella salivae DSM 15606]|uniref:Uncharacterized protein n=2 Tax=Segatella salivae TaxID=228604 RepID=U2MGG6_9BACT|nr:hypothetical protein HMPREF9420_0142 [Segatella salivae DSM 15606]ERK00755.1 hypothetical protein HMPREF9145_2109 [Segatella salivae F0493]